MVGGVDKKIKKQPCDKTVNICVGWKNIGQFVWAQLLYLEKLLGLIFKKKKIK